MNNIPDEYDIADIDLKDIKENSIKFRPPITHARVIEIYDGDTITIAQIFNINGNCQIYQFKLRIYGIDTAEIRTKDQNEKQCANIAKQRLHELIYGKMIRVEQTPEIDKYGRILARIYINIDDVEREVADILIGERLAVSYLGQTKQKVNNWMNYYNNGILD